MKRYQRRHEDPRPLQTDERASVSWRPAHLEHFRWLPRHGEPLCIAEWITQGFVRLLAYLPIYTAIVTTLVLLLLIFGIPWVEGD